MRKISVEKYAQSLYEAVKDLPKQQVKLSLENFIKLLLKNKDLKLAEKIMRAFEIYAKRQEGILDVQIISAQGLNDSEKKELKNKIKKERQMKEVNLVEKTEKDLIGGLIIKIGDTIYDNSLKTRLDLLKQEIK